MLYAKRVIITAKSTIHGDDTFRERSANILNHKWNIRLLLADVAACTSLAKLDV